MTPTLMLSCAAAVVTPAAKTIAASVILLAYCLMFCPSIVRAALAGLVATRSVRGISSTLSLSARVRPRGVSGSRVGMITWGANDRASRNCRMLRGNLHSFTPAEGCSVGLVFRAVIMVPRAYSLRLEPGDDLARDGLDLLGLVSIGNEDDLLRSDRQVRLELLDAIIDRPHDGAILGRFAPSGEIPFLAEPFHHSALDGLAGLTDVDRQLRGVE